MSLFIQSNTTSLMAQMYLSRSTAALSKNFERLSSGYRVNSASDDPAGLSIAARMKSEAASFIVAERNTNDGISMVQTADGALSQMDSMLSRMRQLAVESSNGSLVATDRSFLGDEYNNLLSEIDRIANTTFFNGQTLLGGQPTAFTFQVGVMHTGNDIIATTFGGVSTTSLSLGGTSVGIDQSTSQSAIDAISGAIDAVSTYRAHYGGVLNHFRATVANIDSMRTGLDSSIAQILDTDIAQETASMAQNQVLTQAGAAVLAQANQAPKLALTLLQ